MRFGIGVSPHQRGLPSATTIWMDASVLTSPSSSNLLDTAFGKPTLITLTPIAWVEEIGGR